MTAETVDQQSAETAGEESAPTAGNQSAPTAGEESAPTAGEQSGPTASRESGPTAGQVTGEDLDQKTGAGAAPAAAAIRAKRERIDAIDQAIIDLWLERASLSQEVGKTRMASGGTRLVLAREREIVERFRSALGPDGTQVALLLLRSGRGPL